MNKDISSTIPIQNSTLWQKFRQKRLPPEEIVSLECSDKNRFNVLKERCDDFIFKEVPGSQACPNLFRCNPGNTTFTIAHDGYFHLCFSLRHPACIYNLRKGNLMDAWQNFVPKIRRMKSTRSEFIEQCSVCPIINLCLWCPAHAYLETGELDVPVDYFCNVARARAALIETAKMDL